MSLATSLRGGSKSSKMSTGSHYVISQSASHLHADTLASSQSAKSVKSIASINMASNDLEQPIVEGNVDVTEVDKTKSTIRLVTPSRVRSFHEDVGSTPMLLPFRASYHEDLAKESSKENMPSETQSISDSALDSTLGLDRFPLPPSQTPSLNAKGTPTTPLKEPSNDANSPKAFVFGSPANAVSKEQFDDSAAAVLEEMNRRLGISADSIAATRIVNGKLDLGIPAISSQPSILAPQTKKPEGRFGKAHQKHFQQ